MRLQSASLSPEVRFCYQLKISGAKLSPYKFTQLGYVSIGCDEDQFPGISLGREENNRGIEASPEALLLPCWPSRPIPVLAIFWTREIASVKFCPYIFLHHRDHTK